MSEENTRPNTADLYRQYREQGYSQQEANSRAIQDVINWGVANGHLDSKWATK